LTQDALQLTEQVIKFYKSKLGEDHPDTLTSMHNLALGYSEAGRQAEALQLTEQVVELYKSKLGEHLSDTLKSIKLLAYISKKTGEDLQRFKAARLKQHRLSRLWQQLRL
jgi:predicted nuclease of restriction endonuclease-like RecB superfamily